MNRKKKPQKKEEKEKREEISFHLPQSVVKTCKKDERKSSSRSRKVISIDSKQAATAANKK